MGNITTSAQEHQLEHPHPEHHKDNGVTYSAPGGRVTETRLLCVGEGRITSEDISPLRWSRHRDGQVGQRSHPARRLSRGFSCINGRRIHQRCPSSFGVTTTRGADRGKDCLPALKSKANCKGKGILTVATLVAPRWDTLGTHDRGLFDRGDPDNGAVGRKRLTDSPRMVTVCGC